MKLKKRKSFNETGLPLKPHKRFHDIGDGHSIDAGQNFLTLIWKFGWLTALCLAILVFMVKSLFPDFVERNARYFNKISASYWADQAIELTRSGGIRNFKLVGTGLHPHFKEFPNDKKLFFFDGYILVMRDYFTNQVLLELENRNITWDGVTNVPLTDIDFDRAQELCAKLEARLPYFVELKNAELLCQRHGKNLIKPNLKGCKFNPDKRMWTATAEPGFLFGDSDNYRIFQPGIEDEALQPEFQDNGFESGDIGFRCVKDVEVGHVVGQ